ncbi:dehydrogenase/reductase SDR family member 2, mitochondrial [Physeter macrocephalus]|uniref:Dehydrogenase/reductase SDR family member 2, mitochondrial n=1 Tax=Physeter macrocephalus TaxID=9755 RepID=A0A2Y9TGZ2_PHYMC|nr:dehydrogenase/reductase SDR family member 2, mitochondrial [Physeter catodon]|eukprot:XP_023990216.1 dehydrogenase/reductase SDR family member 2, mitochondrial [Physeter catodon]
MASVINEVDSFPRAEFTGKQTSHWPPCRACIPGGLFRPCAGLSVQLSSSGVEQKGILANQVAVVTGPTDGIGFTISRHLAQDGAHVVVSNQKQQNVDLVVAALKGVGLNVMGTVCHVGKGEDREKLVAMVLEHCRGVDFLVCVPGVNPLTESTVWSSEQVWDKILDVNVKSSTLLLSQLLPHMQKRGSVVLVSSVAAYIPLAKIRAYSVSKLALLGLTQTLAVELAPKNICVNCLVPGIINTDCSQMLFEDPTLWNCLERFHGIQRVGWPEDCAELVSFLCSSDASYITGKYIMVPSFSPTSEGYELRAQACLLM